MALADATTALWPYGGPGCKYGSFSGKTASPPSFAGTIPDITLVLNSAATEYDLSEYFANADSYSIDPAVETGWSLATDTGILTVDPTALGVFGPYVVTATNAGGDTDSNWFSVTVYEEVLPQGGDDAPRRKDYSQALLERWRVERDQLRRQLQDAAGLLAEPEAEEAPAGEVEAVEAVIRDISEYVEAMRPEPEVADIRADIRALIASTEDDLIAAVGRMLNEIVSDIESDRIH